MCGLIAAPAETDLGPGLAAIAHRGPDGSAMLTIHGCTLGHARLAVQDPTPAAAQPFTWGPVTLVYNGELFNTAELRAALVGGQEFASTGDTEVLAMALALHGPAAVLPALNGMFTMAWTDTREAPGTLHAARDRFGEIPLHLCGGGPFLVASELKAFRALGRSTRPGETTDVPPGSWVTLAGGGLTSRSFHHPMIPAAPAPEPAAGPGLLRSALTAAAARRAVSDIPVCTLLSGGIDSAVIALELRQIFPRLVAYTAVMDPRSPDLRAARTAASAIGAELREVHVPPPAPADLARVIDVIEMPHKAQVEIGWPCLHLAAAMARDGFRVTYSGEGADELFASYGFAYHAIRANGWDGARRALVAAQARKNFPRVNKAFAAYGVEARLPFLDPGVVALIMGLDQPAVTCPPGHRPGPKAVMSAAYTGALPDVILRRPKLAFQDGLGMKRAAAGAVTDPARFYRAEFRRAYG